VETPQGFTFTPANEKRRKEGGRKERRGSEKKAQ
jgi:hypothetical protein